MLRRVDRLAVGVLGGAFLVSRIVAYVAGVRYDASLLRDANQYLRLEDLQDHLLQSLWYQHAQPPLFNLLIGLILKFSPLTPERTFHVLWLVLGVVLVAVVYLLLRALHVPRWLSLTATVVITCSPTIILYENWLAYEYPLIVGLTAVALTSHRWVTTGRLRWLATTVGIAGACVLTRALINPVWFAVLVALLLLARRPKGRWVPALAIVSVPVVLMAGILLKNAVLFGSPSFSSWIGWNLQRVTIEELPEEQRAELVRNGTLTPLASYPGFLPLEKYDQVRGGPCTPGHPDVPVLADPTKRDGIDNFNAECYLPLTKEALRNSLAAARADPKATARSIVGSFQIWGESSSQYAFLYDNRQKIDGWDTVYRQVVLLDVPWDPPVQLHAGWWIPIGTPGGRWRFSILVVLATGVTAVAGLRAMWRVLRRRASAIDATVAVIGSTVLAVTLVGNLLEIGENNRFRVMVEPLTFVAFVWACWATVRWWRDRSAGANDDAAAAGSGRLVDGSVAGAPDEAEPEPVDQVVGRDEEPVP